MGICPFGCLQFFHANKFLSLSHAAETWAAVRQLTGRCPNAPVVDGVTAETLNQHHAATSTDRQYRAPQRRHTAAHNNYEPVSECQVFFMLDKLSVTATGLDHLPAWFLRTGAPFFSKPIARLFNRSIATSTVPHQWKQAFIHPVAKTTNPVQNFDYRPISITPILSRTLERVIVRTSCILQS